MLYNYSHLGFHAYLMSAIVGSSLVSAATVTWGINGHEYEVIDNGGDLSWDDAKDEAEALTTCNGAVNGRLATAELAGEDAFMKGLSGFPSSGLGPWIGGKQISSSGDADENWVWIVSGDAIPEKGDSDDGWYPSEPQDWPAGDGEDGDEQCLLYYRDDTSIPFGWGDAPCDPWARSPYYMVEYDVVSGCTDPAAANYDPDANCDDSSCVKCEDTKAWPKIDNGCTNQKRICDVGLDECVKCYNDQVGKDSDTGCREKRPFCVSKQWGHLSSPTTPGEKCALCRNTEPESSSKPDLGCTSAAPRCTKNGKSISNLKYGNKCGPPLCDEPCKFIPPARKSDGITCAHNAAGNPTCYQPPKGNYPNGCYSGTTLCIPV